MLEVKNLGTSFITENGVVSILDDVSFVVPRGEIVGIVGESGSGKSVTVNTILGLLRANRSIVKGRAEFLGVDLLSLTSTELRKIRGNQIGYVAQNPFSTLNPILRIARQFENVMRAHARVDRTAVHLRAASLLAEVGINNSEQILAGYAHELSGGMAQRVVIALALCMDPKLLIADEPTTALDLSVQKQILDLLATLSRESGRSLMIITHDLGIVANYCDRVVVMYRGRVVEQGVAKEVFREPRNPYTAHLLSSA